ncbi:hypothetical protein C8J57DRAFT_1623547 [Mycena rebaudengoi]|nr:hypothetical protein C8J57DRAFT_1623547 [Mycena rebaudengoi]
MRRHPRAVPNPGDDFKLRLSKAEKLERGKLASAAYYVKNRDDIRAKRRIQMAAKRATLKSKRRVSEKLGELKAVEPVDVELPNDIQSLLSDRVEGSQGRDLEAAQCLLEMHGVVQAPSEQVQCKDWDDLPDSDEVQDTDESEGEQSGREWTPRYTLI